MRAFFLVVVALVLFVFVFPILAADVIPVDNEKEEIKDAVVTKEYKDATVVNVSAENIVTIPQRTVAKARVVFFAVDYANSRVTLITERGEVGLGGVFTPLVRDTFVFEREEWDEFIASKSFDIAVAALMNKAKQKGKL